MLQSAKELRDCTLQAIDGEIGPLEDLYFDDFEWKVRYLTANTGGWLSGRRILLSPLGLTGAMDANSYLHMNLTMEQIRNSPEIDEAKPVSRQQEMDLHRYYGWNYYGFGPGASGMYTLARGARGEDSTDRRAGDPNLRSVREVTGYGIRTTDDDLGHVEDFIVDDTTWEVRYMVVDTAALWFGKKVLVSPLWAREVDWSRRSVQVSLSADDIKRAPEWDGLTPIDQDYDEKLFIHYSETTYVV
ncbi:MAG TPA: PRC-barrel domain-containing protein [Actinomycetota bacterium]|nr:PRC-barrel domain-containing protein [Actinomycetota bacterium]